MTNIIEKYVRHWLFYFLDPSDCKYRWEALRCQYRKVLSKQKTVTGQASSDVKYKYREQLQFLKAHMKEHTLDKIQAKSEKEET